MAKQFHKNQRVTFQVKDKVTNEKLKQREISREVSGVVIGFVGKGADVQLRVRVGARGTIFRVHPSVVN